MLKYILLKNQEITGMARVGYSSGLEIYVNTDDAGRIPHFHIRDPKDWKRFHSCIQIESANYFLHNGKEDTLNSNQRKDLMKFMKSSVQISKYKNKFNNNWELICFLWDINNSNRQISEGAEMPDYTMLKE